jgi:segregation and condensation protein A
MRSEEIPTDVSPDEAPASPAAAFRFALPNFEGPLDLLLHLIQAHEIDIFDIPIALITVKYLEHLEQMRELNLDIAGEFFVMAATLAHIKSRMLLPKPEPLPEEPQEQADPRAELVRRLLAYQKYRDAAEKLARRDLYERDVFGRRARPEPLPLEEGELGLAEVSVIKLVELLDRSLKRAQLVMPHEILAERISIGDAIQTIAERLRASEKVGFAELLADRREATNIIVTFLALLEMAKLRMVRIFQEDVLGEIWVSPTSPVALSETAEVNDDYRS